MLQGFAWSSAKAPHACSRLPGKFCNGVVFIGAAYSVAKVARQSQACAWRICTYLCAKTAQNPVTMSCFKINRVAHAFVRRNPDANFTLNFNFIIADNNLRIENNHDE